MATMAATGSVGPANLCPVRSHWLDSAITRRASRIEKFLPSKYSSVMNLKYTSSAGISPPTTGVERRRGAQVDELLANADERVDCEAAPVRIGREVRWRLSNRGHRCRGMVSLSVLTATTEPSTVMPSRAAAVPVARSGRGPLPAWCHPPRGSIAFVGRNGEDDRRHEGYEDRDNTDSREASVHGGELQREHEGGAAGRTYG